MEEDEDVDSPARMVLGRMPSDFCMPSSMGGAAGDEVPPKHRQSPVFSPPDCAGDGRVRDIYPLPLLEVDLEVAKKGTCRSVQKRCLKRIAVAKRVNMAITSLNSLYFGTDEFKAPTICRELNSLPLLQRDSIKHIIKQVKDAGGPPRGACYSEALKALRVASNGYYDTAGGVGDTIDMNLKLLSLPTLAGQAVDLHSTLKGKVGEMLLDFENQMLQDDDNWGAIQGSNQSLRPYNDPQLAKREFYSAFLHRLQQCGILTISTTPRGRVGAFCVSKKPKEVDGKMISRQRLILDCRQTNLLFRAPPLTELGSLAALGEGYLRPNEKLFVGGADIQDCFYACHIPPELSEFFCFSWDISMREAREILGDNIPNHLSGLSDEVMVSPSINVLPMGYSWSFYIVQQLHEQQTLATLGFSRERLILDARPVGDFGADRCWGMPYCDNVHVLSTDEQSCEDDRIKICNQLRSIGFGVHEEVSASNIFPTLGGIIDGCNGTITPTCTRLWNLILGFEFCINHPVSSDFVRCLLGHAMTVCVLCRPGMSVFRALYDYSAKGFGQQKLWETAIRECKIFVGILPLLISNLRRPWAKTIVCSDASPSGFGLIQREASEEQIKDVGSWNERWRFKRLPPEQWRPRQRSLGLDVFSHIETARRPDPIPEESFEYCENDDFPEVPFEMLRPEDWSTSKIGMWKRTSDHITLKEGKAFVLGMRRITRNQQLRGCRVLFLVDNMGLAMAISKGRSHNFKLLRVCQQYAALSLASNTVVRVRWIPSELNPADAPSRGSLQPGSSWHSFFKLSEKCKDIEGGQADEDSWGGEEEDEAEPEPPHSEDDFSESEFERDKTLEAPFREGRGQWFRDGGGSDVTAGSSQRGVSSEEAIPSIHEGIQGLLQGARPGVAGRLPRCSASRLLRRVVLGGAVGGSGREDYSSSRVSLHRMEREAGPCKAGAQGLEKVGSPTEPTASSEASCFRDCKHYDGKGLERHGSEASPGLRLLPPPIGGNGACGGSSHGCRQAIPESGSHNQRSRSGPSGQDGHLRQHAAPGQSIDQSMAGAAVVANVKESREEPEDLYFQASEVQRGPSDGRGSSRSSTSPCLSTSPWRSKRRPQQSDQRLQLSPRERTVEDRFECSTICQDRKDPKTSAAIEQTSSRILQVEPDQYAANHRRKDSPQAPLSSKDDLSKCDGGLRFGNGRSHFSGLVPNEHLQHQTWRTFRGRMMLEIFAGSGRLSSAARRKGIPMFPVDILIDAQDDVLNHRTRQHIFSLISTGKVAFVWIGMPCTTFSRARQHDGLGPPPLRSDSQPLGLDNLRPRDRKKLHEGNALFFFAVNLIKLCLLHNVPWALENPATSRCWITPQLTKLAESCDIVHFDFCQYQEPWRKRTTVMFSLVDFSSLHRICKGTGSICSRSGKRHLNLKGISPSGKFWTLVAQPYPISLVECISELLLQQIPVSRSHSG